MKKVKALFVGMYPDNVNTYRNVFFQNLIFAMADAGVDCTVISPVPVTKYRSKVKTIPTQTYHTTPNGSKVHVYYPRYISASSKIIGSFNTGVLSEKFFEKAAVKQAKKLKDKFDFVYGHFFLNGGLAAAKIGKILSLPSFVAYGECDYTTEIIRHYRELKRSEVESLSGIIAVSTKKCQ